MLPSWFNSARIFEDIKFISKCRRYTLEVTPDAENIKQALLLEKGVAK
jgi:hypothetical protein